MVNFRLNQNQRSQFHYCNPRNQFDGKIAKSGQKDRLKGRKLNKNPNLKKKFKRGRYNFDAPLNTTSYIIRLRNKNGGLKKPLFAHWSGDVIDIAEEQWGVDCYGSMNGLIRVRDNLVCEDECRSSVSDVDVEGRLDSGLSRFEMIIPKNLDDSRIAMFESDGDDDKVVCEDEHGSSVSDVDEHVEVERRLDVGSSRFEMALPKNLDDSKIAMFRSDGDDDKMVCEDECGSSVSDVDEYAEVERRFDSGLSRFKMVLPKKFGGDQNGRIAKLEEENVEIKKRVVVIENEIDDMKRRLSCIERKNQGGVVDVFQEEVVDMKVN